MRSVKISIQQDDFNIQDECLALREGHQDIGALATFIGLVRDIDDAENQSGKVKTLTLEHYPGMTEKSLQKIAEEADRRWSILDVCIIHRIGTLAAAEQIVFVAVSSLHRQDAFSACAYIMDFLKTSAPFWKKSSTENGEYWVEARDSDTRAAENWAEAHEKR